jgi:phage tail sheath protein FI
MGASPPQLRDRLTNPVMVTIGGALAAADLIDVLNKADSPIDLKGGVDGTGDPAGYEEALDALQALEDISIIAAPGLSTFDAIAADVHQKLIGHAEAPRAYRIAVLETPANKEPGEIVALKGKIDSTKAALYYPWVSVANPAAATDPTQPTVIDLPPSGHVCGIYARTDIQRGVWKAPANETVTGAIGLQRAVSFGEQELLNPLGINCIRALPNRGIRVWGARTISSDPEWKYVNIRRYFIYLENSIDRGTQWAVFEPNGERLWANVRTTVSDFLYNEWVSGALLGATPKEAFFVLCDRSTMTQNDLDNGRLICLIGVAAIKPAEFVIFRIGQKTADSRG